MESKPSAKGFLLWKSRLDTCLGLVSICIMVITAGIDCHSIYLEEICFALLSETGFCSVT